MTDTHPPILSPELCERVAAVHQARCSRWAQGGGSPKRVYLLSDVYCGECGMHMRGQFIDNVRYYRHTKEMRKPCAQKNYIPASVIENAVFDYLKFFQTPDKVRERIEDKARKLAKQSASPEIESARRKLAECVNKLDRLKSLFVDGEIDRGEYERRKAKIEEQQKAASQVLKATPLDVKTLEDLLPKIDQLALIIREGDPIHQRAALNALFERVEIMNRKISKAIPREWARPFFNGASK